MAEALVGILEARQAVTPYQLLMAQSLRDEIAFFNLAQLVLVLAVTVLLVIAYAVAYHPHFRSVALVVPFLIASALFAIGRTDLLMHRAGAYLTQMESATDLKSATSILDWEEFKEQLPATRALPLYDIGGLIVWAYFLIWSERRARELLDASSARRFHLGTGALVLLGALSIPIAALTA